MNDPSLQSIVGCLMVKRGGKSGLTLSSPKTCKKRLIKKMLKQADGPIIMISYVSQLQSK